MRLEESGCDGLDLGHDASGLDLLVLIVSELAHVGDNIHVRGTDPQLPLAGPDLPAGVQSEDDRSGEVGFEEVLGVRLATDGEESDVELGNKTDDVEEETNVTANDTVLGLVRKLLDGATRVCPTLAETDVGKVDATPDEEVGKTGKRQEPGEENVAGGCQVDKGKKTHGHLKDGGGNGTTLLVDVGEELGSHATSSKSLKGAGRGEGGAVGDTDDGNCDHSIEDGGENLDTSEADSNDEGRVLRMGTVGVEKVRVASGNNETQDEEADDVEESDTPEDLLDSLRKSFSGIGGFSSCETDQLSTTEGERGGNEDTAEALKAIAEGLPILPVLYTDVATSIGGNTTNIDNNAENDETNTRHDLDDGENEFDLTVGSYAQELDSTLSQVSG